MTDLELETLNAALLPYNEMVRSRTQDGETVWWLCRLVRAMKIEDPVTFAATYGVTVLPGG